jgi:hypothetical protein
VAAESSALLLTQEATTYQNYHVTAAAQPKGNAQAREREMRSAHNVTTGIMELADLSGYIASTVLNRLRLMPPSTVLPIAEKGLLN